MYPNIVQPLRLTTLERPVCTCGHTAAAHMKHDQFCMAGECDCPAFAARQEQKQAA